jgi:hypothetical protein
MTIQFPVSFETADFFSTTDPEELTHTTVEDALRGCFYSNWCDTNELSEEIRANTPVTVTAYKRKSSWDYSQKIVSFRFARFMEDALEDFDDEFGEPNGRENVEFPKAEIAAIEALLVELFRALPVWQCEPCGSIELSAEQCMELLEVHLEMT